MSNYATKSDLNGATVWSNTSKFGKKADLASLKSDVYKLDIDQLETIPVDLRKLSNAGKNNVVKKTVFDELVRKVNSHY